MKLDQIRRYEAGLARLSFRLSSQTLITLSSLLVKNEAWPHPENKRSRGSRTAVRITVMRFVATSNGLPDGVSLIADLLHFLPGRKSTARSGPLAIYAEIRSDVLYISSEQLAVRCTEQCILLADGRFRVRCATDGTTRMA